MSTNTEFLCDIFFHVCKYLSPCDITPSWYQVDINCNSLRFTLHKLSISKSMPCRSHTCPADTNQLTPRMVPNHESSDVTSRSRLYVPLRVACNFIIVVTLKLQIQLKEQRIYCSVSNTLDYSQVGKCRIHAWTDWGHVNEYWPMASYL